VKITFHPAANRRIKLRQVANPHRIADIDALPNTVKGRALVVILQLALAIRQLAIS